MVSQGRAAGLGERAGRLCDAVLLRTGGDEGRDGSGEVVSQGRRTGLGEWAVRFGVDVRSRSGGEKGRDGSPQMVRKSRRARKCGSHPGAETVENEVSRAACGLAEENR